MGEGRGKSMGEKEKEFLSVALDSDHPPILFFSMCSLVIQWGKVLPPQQNQKLRRSPAVKRDCQSQQKGSCVRDAVFWIILFSMGRGREGSSQSGQLDGSICVLQVHPGFP